MILLREYSPSLYLNKIIFNIINKVTISISMCYPVPHSPNPTVNHCPWTAACTTSPPESPPCNLACSEFWLSGKTYLAHHSKLCLFLRVKDDAHCPPPRCRSRSPPCFHRAQHGDHQVNVHGVLQTLPQTQSKSSLLTFEVSNITNKNYPELVLA